MTDHQDAGVRPHFAHEQGDEALLDYVQRQTFRYFWDGAHPVSGLARDKIHITEAPQDDLVTSGGSGFGIMAIIVACSRGWVTRDQALTRIEKMLACLIKAPCYHGMFAHFLNGATGATIPFSRKDDGGDLVESSFLFQGLLCARAYFDQDNAREKWLRDTISWLWNDAEWNWFTRDGRKILTWHWSPNNGFGLDHDIRGWNECLITYVLAAASPRFPISMEVYRDGWAESRVFSNGRQYEGLELPLGPDFGGPLFFAHFSFLGLDPRGLRDAYADYWRQNVHHTLIHYLYCCRNPHGYKGYGPGSWGLSASESVIGYSAHTPDNDLGVISPSAALSSFPYAPKEAMAALRNYYEMLGDKIWGPYGFVDGFSEQHDWASPHALAISQGPIVVMMENYRSGLLWKLFMGIPEIQAGLRKLGFQSPHFDA